MVVQFRKLTWSVLWARVRLRWIEGGEEVVSVRQDLSSGLGHKGPWHTLSTQRDMVESIRWSGWMICPVRYRGRRS
jgi:hypothetical protein